jgi:UDP-3-O-[3-hydroxymyristoyl] glucosamine N-acyltransferase
LTDTVVGEEAVIEHAIIDKRVRLGEKVRVGKIRPGSEPVIAMIGKNSEIPPETVIEAGAVIGTDVAPSDFSSSMVRGDDYLQTKRLANEV